MTKTCLFLSKHFVKSKDARQKPKEQNNVSIFTDIICFFTHLDQHEWCDMYDRTPVLILLNSVYRY